MIYVELDDNHMVRNAFITTESVENLSCIEFPYNVSPGEASKYGRDPNTNEFLLVPARPAHETSRFYNLFDWSGLKWVLNVDDFKREKLQEITNACSNSILLGFKSLSLGGEYLYPCNLLDQANLNSSVVMSLMETSPAWGTPFWCADMSGVWEQRIHTAEQIQQVAKDCRAHILLHSNTNAFLQNQVNLITVDSANPEDELSAITWSL